MASRATRSSNKTLRSDQGKSKISDTAEPVQTVKITIVNVNNNSTSKMGKASTMSTKRGATDKTKHPVVTKRAKQSEEADNLSKSDRSTKARCRKGTKNRNDNGPSTVVDSQVSEQPQSDFDDSEQVFEEDGNLIKMKVQADEDDFSDGSGEEGELNDDDSETDNETENESENETEGEPSEVDPNRSSDEQYSDDL